MPPATDLQLKQLEIRLMAKLDEILAVVQNLDTGLEEVAADINNLLQLVQNPTGGLTEEEANQVKAQLESLQAKLANIANLHNPPA